MVYRQIRSSSNVHITSPRISKDEKPRSFTYPLSNFEKIKKLGKKDGIVFILGPGASEDSGIEVDKDNRTTYELLLESRFTEILTLFDKWYALEPIFSGIKDKTPGPTYLLIQKLALKFPGSFIITQNVDGLAKNLMMPIVEINGNIHTMICDKCQKIQTTDLDNLRCKCKGWFNPDLSIMNIKISGKTSELIHEMLDYVKYAVFVCVNLDDPYVDSLLNKCTTLNSKIIHIHPRSYYRRDIPKNSIWYKKNSASGLKHLLDKYRRGTL